MIILLHFFFCFISTRITETLKYIRDCDFYYLVKPGSKKYFFFFFFCCWSFWFLNQILVFKLLFNNIIYNINKS